MMAERSVPRSADSLVGHWVVQRAVHLALLMVVWTVAQKAGPLVDSMVACWAGHSAGNLVPNLADWMVAQKAGQSAGM